MNSKIESIRRRSFLTRIGRFAGWGLALRVGGSALVASAARAAAPESRQSDADADADAQRRSAQRLADAAGPGISKQTLVDSDFAYISPLDAKGSESTCHAEVWYAWLDGSVVVIVSRDGWKAQAAAKGRDTARIWIGNYGRWKGFFGTRNEAFRKAPSFDAQVERVRDEGVLDRLLATYEEKYPAEIASWRDRMRNGFSDGSRVILRYRPSPALRSTARPTGA